MEEFKHIMFHEDGHKYINQLTGEQYISVTQAIKKVQPKVNWDFWAVYKQLQENHTVKAWYDKGMIQVDGKWVSYKKYLNLAKKKRQQWREISDEATKRGTFIHLFLENIFNRKLISVPDEYKEYMTGPKKFYKDHKHLKPVYAEVVVGDDEFFFAGQVDRPFEVGENELAIFDFKGLALDTPVPTPDGFKLMENIKIGDNVFDGNGNITKVQHVSDVHYNPCYKITFNDNSNLIADYEHKWVIEEKIKWKYVTKTYTTEDLYNYYVINGKHNKLKIERFDKLEGKDIKLPIDPYVLGLWLADGSTHTGRITCINQNIWKEIQQRGYKLSNNLEKRIEKKAECRTLYGLHTELKKLNLLKNKHIPDLYMRASHKQRLDLLRGFMDGDGHYNVTRKNAVCITTQQWQAEALHCLVSSLGCNATIHNTIVKGFGLVKPGFHVTFSSYFIPFLCRNANFPARRTVRQKNLYIKKVEPVNIVPTKCISVTSKDCTYLAGKNYVKTHNTDKQIETENKYGTTLLKPFEHLPDTNFSKYTIQLNMYRAAIERNTKYKVTELKIVHLTKDDYQIYDIPKIDVKLFMDDIRRTHIQS